MDVREPLVVTLFRGKSSELRCRFQFEVVDKVDDSSGIKVIRDGNDEIFEIQVILGKTGTLTSTEPIAQSNSSKLYAAFKFYTTKGGTLDFSYTFSSEPKKSSTNKRLKNG